MNSTYQQSVYENKLRAGTWAVRAVALVFVLEALCYTTWLPRLSEIKALLDLSDKDLGLALAAVPIGAIIVMPLTGMFTTKVSARNCVVVCLFFLAVAILGLSFVKSFNALFVVFLLIGAGTGSTGVAMNFAAYEVEMMYDRKIMSSCHGMFSVGGVLGSLWGGIASDLSVHLFAHLFITSGMVLTILLLIFKFIPAIVKQDDYKERDGFRLNAISAQLLFISAMAFSVLLIEGMVVDWSTVYLRDVTGVSGTAAGIGFAAYSFCMACGRFRGDGVVMAVGERRILIIGSLMIVVAISLTVLTQMAAVAIVCFGVAGLGLSVLMPILFRLSAQTPGFPAGVNISVTSMIGYSGFLVGPVLVGSLSEWVGLGVALGVIVPIALFVTFFSPRLVSLR